MISTKKPRSLLGDAADLAGPIVTDPRALVRAQLRKATFVELLTELKDRAMPDLEFRNQLLAAAALFGPKEGVPGRLPPAEELLLDFEIRMKIVQENPELQKALVLSIPDSARPKSWSKNPRKVTQAWFAHTYSVKFDSVAKKIQRAQPKFRTR